MDLLKNLDNMITAKLILTGKETYDPEYSTVSKHDALEAMIEFAKLHVEAALKQASINANLYLHNPGWKHSSDIKTVKCHNYDASINKDSILNAYSLENIK